MAGNSLSPDNLQVVVAVAADVATADYYKSSAAAAAAAGVHVNEMERECE